MPAKHLKNLLAHTTGIRHPKIEQFSVAGALTGTNARANSSAQVQFATGGASAGAAVAEQVATLSKYLSDLRLAQQVSADTTNENTRALIQNTVTKTLGSSSSSTAGSLLAGIFGSTLGLSPILKGLFSLFGGRSAQAVQPLAPFTLPPAIQYEGGYSSSNRGQVANINYGQNGVPRVSAPAPATNVQIQVNAMDSRSFLDHSADIAAAVREAILHSNSLNDVIADLS
jgi:hypothetical protein